MNFISSSIGEEELSIVGVRGWRVLDLCGMMIEVMIFFFTNRIKRTIRVFLVCYARGANFGAGGKFVFLANLARLCLCMVYWMSFCENASLVASAAGHIAENGPKQVF